MEEIPLTVRQFRPRKLPKKFGTKTRICINCGTIMEFIIDGFGSIKLKDVVTSTIDERIGMQGVVLELSEEKRGKRVLVWWADSVRRDYTLRQAVASFAVNQKKV